MTFQMQSHHDDQWTPMEAGAGGNVWRPRTTAIEAATKCLTWTGLTGIPAMQVVDLSTGDVVWRDSHAYPEAGAPIAPPWDRQARSAARAALQDDASSTPHQADVEQDALF